MKPARHIEKLEHFVAYNPTAAELLQTAKREPMHFEDGLTSGQRVLSWICQLVAAGIMVETLFFKFTAAPESVYIFRKMGTEPWWRWGQGIWELLASICLLIPRLRWMGGILTTGAMLAAILSHLTWLGYSVMGDHGLLFGMATVTFTCGFIVMMLHRHSIPWITPLSDW
jgi:uncharacterized membrane protein YphA (DoxX/SURF4 family)